MSESDDDERFKNLMIFKVWMTDKELDDCYGDPGFWIIIAIIILFCIGGVAITADNQPETNRAHTTKR